MGGLAEFESDARLRVAILTGPGQGILRGDRSDRIHRNQARRAAAEFSSGHRPEHQRQQAGHRGGQRLRLCGRLAVGADVRSVRRQRDRAICYHRGAGRARRALGCALIHMVPQRVLLELLITATRFRRNGPMSSDLSTTSSPPGEVMAKARELASDILAGSPLVHEGGEGDGGDVSRGRQHRGAAQRGPDFRAGLSQRRRDRRPAGFSREAKGRTGEATSRSGRSRPQGLKMFRRRGRD